ncbi:kinase suppressor of Ras 2-like isoform X4 [Lytechinus variegatus]|uniref:kinase suppressor of Ras 2-like isoform X4 n=1 Tax=Lytechinus variegatus TaxID=7654 RepID=UPI001BB28DE1|nr:kinase suppressor of Ras 2-like isoform X4 [Lytechinus variegatus]
MSEAGSSKCLSSLRDVQLVIESRITYLNGLRKMDQNSAYTKNEMRTVKDRLFHLFGRQLASKHGMDTGSGCSELNRYPDFRQWLHVVDVQPPAVEMLIERVHNLSQLIKLSESEIRTIMKICACEEKEITRFLDAVKSLKKAYIANYPSKDRNTEDGAKSPDTVSMGNSIETVGDHARSRSNSPSVSSSPEQKRPSIDSLNSDLSEVPSVPITPPPFDSHIFKLPVPTPPHTPTFNKRGKSRGTPPPTKKINPYHLPLPSPSNWSSVDHLNTTRSGLGFDSATLGRTQGRSRDPRDRRYSDDNAMRLSSPSRSEERLTDIGLPPKQPTKLVPPKSPRTQTRSNMIHAIKHRFSKKTSMRPQTCDYCHEKIVFLQHYKCKDCKYVCHSNCKFHAEKVPSCGLPRKYEEIFKSTIEHARSETQTAVNVASSTGDSSSNPSSTTSSTPSSPAPFTSTSGIPPPSPAQPSPSPLMTVPQFKFPPDVSDDFLDNNENVTSTSSDRTITIDSHDTHDPFTDSEKTLPEQTDPTDEISDPDTYLVATRKNSQKLLSEWDIPFEQLEIQDLIGTGRFGEVHKGKWHGDVAIKMMDIDTDDEMQLQAFKREVSFFRKTRHEFVVLFMGACMRPPHLAIVTSLCKGQTLYTHIHLRKDRFNINRTIQIAKQITEGMGYLHHKKIVHKDLKSKNIFIEKDKVVITDFALFSIGRLSKQKTRTDTLVIPDGWLCYLAPELITSLRINTDRNQDMELPFSEKSDVYAFGTIWYELLGGEWPFHKQPVETVIWQVGKGLKQPLNHLQASRDVKEILMLCWSYAPESRPIFPQIRKTILRLPKKKGLHRSPSHPLHLSRSAESVL